MFTVQNSVYKDLGGLWRRPFGILITGIWTSLAEKVSDMAEKLAQLFTQS